MGQSPDSASYNTIGVGIPLVQGNADIKNRVSCPNRHTSKPTKICRPNSVLLSVRAPVGTVGIANQTLCLGRGVCAIESDNNAFLYQFLIFKEDSWRNIEQGGTFTAINGDDIKKFTFIMPCEIEREKIATFLSLIDSRIAAQRKLVELLKKHKRGLSSALFSGKVRIATNAKLRTYRLGDIVRRVTRKNGKATDIPLTISAQYGLIDQREFFSKAVASADMSGYYLLKQGEFAYNRSSSSEYPFGSIKKLERYHQGAVSTLYICFEALGDKDEAEFLKWYFDSFAWHREIGMICAEGARNHGLLNVPTDGFFDTKHMLPSDKDERKKIASLMALADARCECAETELDRLTAIKSGLLQQMFV